MPYGIEVKIIEKTTDGRIVEHWRRLRPAMDQPYVWETFKEAADMRRICYPDALSTTVRIVEVSE